MKIGKIQVFYFTILTISLFSCKIDPKNEYSKKNKIGVFGENQGMVCFEGTLYDDSTFYINGDAFLDYAEGTFKTRGKNIYFKITSGDIKHFKPSKLIWNDTLNSYVNPEDDAEINYVQFINND